MSDFQLQVRGTASGAEIVLREAGDVERLRSRVNVDLPRVHSLAAEIRRILSRACRHGGGNQEDHDDFQTSVSSLTQLIIPAELERELASLRDHSITLDVHKPLLRLPWELLQVAGECLCLRNGLSRAQTDAAEISPPVTAETAGRSIRVAVVANPEFNLPAASREADGIKRLFLRTASVGRPRVWTHSVTRAALREAFASSDWLHFAGHAGKNEGRTSWQLSDGPFGAAEIVATESANWPRFVFAHACASVGDDVEMPDDQLSIESLAEAFLSVGVRHYLGTIVPVLDEDCRQSAECFYRHVLAGEPIATALQKTRQSMVAQLGSGNLSWAFYILYGPPSEHLVPPVVAECSQLHTRSPHAISTEDVSRDDLVLPLECAACGKPIQTRHGVAAFNDRIVCRKCRRNMPPDGDHSIGSCESTSGAEQQVEADGIQMRVQRFLRRFEHSAKQFQEYFDPSDGQRHSVSLELVSRSQLGATEDRVRFRDGSKSGPHRLSKEYRRFHLTGRTSWRQSAPQIVDVVVYCRDAEFAARQSVTAPVNKIELVVFLQQMRQSDSDDRVLIVASATGWDDDARRFARTTSETDAHDPNTAVVLIDLIDGAVVWCEEDLRLIPLAPLFDLEDETEKVSRVIRHVQAGLPLATSLGAIQVASDLGMSIDLVETAFYILAEDQALQLDEGSEIGFVLSQAQI